MIELSGEGILFQILMIADVSSGWGGGYKKTANKSTDVFYVQPPTLVFCRQTKRHLGRKRPQMEFFRLLELFRCNLLDLSFSFFSSKATFGNKTNPFYEISYYILTKAFKMVTRQALKNAMYCHLKSYSVLQESRNLMKS